MEIPQLKLSEKEIKELDERNEQIKKMFSSLMIPKRYIGHDRSASVREEWNMALHRHGIKTSK